LGLGRGEDQPGDWDGGGKRKRGKKRKLWGEEKKKERGKRKRERKDERRKKIEKINYLFFRNYDSQFILSILLSNNKNKGDSYIEYKYKILVVGCRVQ
jgi:hypothetical protein